MLVDTLFAGGMSPGGGSIITTLGMENMSVSNSVLYFSFDDQVHGNELWRSDGTAAGTLMLKDVNPSVIDQGFQNFYVNPYGANLGTTGVFVGWSQATGYEIYSSNGTPGGTALLKDIAPGGGSSNASQFVVSGGTKAFFTAYSPAGGIELWVTDGTSAGTVQVKDINPGVASSNASGMVAIGSYVYFTADNGVNGQELWASDGTAAGTYMVADIDATSSGGFPRSGSPGGFVFSGGQVFFLANQSTTGRELWVTNGTSGGTHITKNIGPTSSDGNIQGTPIAYNNKVYFAAQDTATNGTELWVSDGSDAGTIMLKNIDSTAFSSGYPTDFVLANNLFFFRAQNAGVSDVYKSDGTEPGTVPVTTGLGLSSIGSLVGAGNKVFFSGQGTSGSELYVTSGATATLLDIFSGPTGSNPNYLTALGSKVVFSAASSAALGNELWVSDGTAGVGHTFMLKDINTNPSASSDPQSFMVVGSRAYFTANDGVNGRELWFTDGTFTIFVTNIGPGGTDGQIQPLRALDNNHLLFLANDGSSGGQELWITDGSAGGTFKASNVVQPDGTFSTGGGFVSLNGGGFPGGNFATVPGLTLGGGDDTFVGGADSDYFDGLGGNDTLIGGTGDDILVGGIGNDVFFVDSLGDFIIEASSGGNDRVAASATYVLNATAEVETMETTSLSGTAAINLYGNGFVQTIVGNNGNNLLDGGGGNDMLIGAGGNDALVGQAGADTMYGGVGDDVFYVDSDFDFVSENAGEGNDRVASAGSYTLATGVSVETLEAINYADTSALNLTGNALNQTITGNNGANMLIGGGGNDTLNGAGGDDTIIGNTSASTMIGGSGNDVFFVYDTSDAVIEASGGGSDRIASAASYTLLATSEVETIETASLASTTAINLTGNQFVNTITGNNGANVLDGKGGNDTLNGAGAADIYAFTTALGAGNIDLVLGFVSSSDKIGLDDAIFTAIVPGALAAGAFVVSSAATDGDDRIIYNQGTGALYYDPDGTGGAAQVQFATLAGGGTLLGSDFLLI